MNMIIVGLGSAGSKIVDISMESLKNKNVDALKSICIDTDKSQTDGVKNVDKVIHLNIDEYILNDMLNTGESITVQLSDKKLKWYKLKSGRSYPFSKLSLMGEGGSGRIRTRSDISLYEIRSNFEEIYNTFRALYDELIAGRVAGRLVDNIMILLVSGSGGGTGSGLVCGISRIIKSIFTTHCTINLILVLPNGHGLQSSSLWTVPNSYCLLKEIEYLRTLTGEEDIYGQKIILGDRNLFSSVILLSMHDFLSYENSKDFIDEDIIPTFLEMLQYGRLIEKKDSYKYDVEGIAKSVIDMTNMFEFINKADDIYGSLCFSQLHVNIHKLSKYCKSRTHIDKLEELRINLSNRRNEIHSLTNGSEEFIKFKDDIIRRNNEGTKKIRKSSKDIWTYIIKNFSPRESIGIKYLQDARNYMMTPLNKLIETGLIRELTIIIDSCKKKVRENIQIGMAVNSDVMRYLEIVEEDMSDTFDSNDEEKIKKEKEEKTNNIEKKAEDLEGIAISSINEYIKVIDDTLQNLNNKINDLDLDRQKRIIIDSSKTGVASTYPIFKIGERDIEEEKKNILFDKIYQTYHIKKDLGCYTLSELINNLGENETDYIRERIKNGFKLKKELSKFDMIKEGINIQQHPISWIVVAAHDDSKLRRHWEDLGIPRGGTMDGAESRIHQLDPELKKTWPMSKWMMISWISGYKLTNNLDYQELEEIFNKLPIERRLEHICYPQAFGGSILE